MPTPPSGWPWFEPSSTSARHAQSAVNGPTAAGARLSGPWNTATVEYVASSASPGIVARYDHGVGIAAHGGGAGNAHSTVMVTTEPLTLACMPVGIAGQNHVPPTVMVVLATCPSHCVRSTAYCGGQ